MILLLDAHALLWWLADDPTMSRSGRAAIEDPANDVIVSAASVWEIEIKRALGELTAPDGLVDAVHAASLGTVPITAADAEHAGRLPPHHRDPFDRVLVVLAQAYALIVLTSDEDIPKYPGVKTLW